MIISVSVSFTFEHDIIHPVTLGKSVTHPLTAPVIAHHTQIRTFSKSVFPSNVIISLNAPLHRRYDF